MFLDLVQFLFNKIPIDFVLQMFLRLFCVSEVVIVSNCLRGEETSSFCLFYFILFYFILFLLFCIYNLN